MSGGSSTTTTIELEVQSMKYGQDDFYQEQDSDSSTNVDEAAESIHLHPDEEDYEEEQESLDVKLNRSSVYKRMELKGESESDKDLIIYSLNESLQIHKEIVERIQNEKDDLEDEYEQEKRKKKASVQQVHFELEKQADMQQERFDQLQQLYSDYQQQLQVKKLEYTRMETKFYSHVNKDLKEVEDKDIYDKIQDLLQSVSSVAIEFLSDQAYIENILDDWWIPNSEIHETILRYSIPLDDSTALLFTEKFIMDTLLQDILLTAIHPGIELNNAFHKMFQWVNKRNQPWAHRMKQEIVSFVVNHGEQQHLIESKRLEITEKLIYHLNQVYEQVDKSKIEEIVDKAMKLNLLLKNMDDPIDIQTKFGKFEHELMTSVNQMQYQVVLIITPLFISTDQQFLIPAKVYCSQ